MKIKLCAGATCTMMGIDNLLDAIEDYQLLIANDRSKYGDKTLDLDIVQCMNYCKEDKKLCPAVTVDDKTFFNATESEIMTVIESYIHQ